MLLRVVCPHCACEIFALPQSAGKVGQCACGGSFPVPAAPARRPPSTRGAALLIAAAVGVGLAAGFWPGKRSTAARPPAPAPQAEGLAPADVGGAGAPALPPLPAGHAVAPRPRAVKGALTAASPAVAPPPSLDARGLLLLYKNDAAGADARYRGRLVRVRGEVVPPPSGAEDTYAAGLVTFGVEEVPPAAYPEPLLSRAGVLLRATPSRRADFRALESGAAVEVEGRCVGWRPDPSTHLGAVVVLEDCQLLVLPKK